MSALTASKKAERKDGLLQAVPVKAANKLWAGGLVCRDTTGYGVSAADTVGFIFAGVADDIYDNTDGANGDVIARCWRKGSFKVDTVGAAITDVGKRVYISDDQTVRLEANVSNSILCGKIVAFESATSVWIDVDVEGISSAEAKTISIVMPLVTVNGTKNFGIFAVSRAIRINKISIASVTKPADADGVITLAIKNYDLSATTDDNLLVAATFNLEGLTAKNSEDLSLTATVADLILAVGDMIHGSIVNDSAAIETDLTGVLTIEYEEL